MVFIILFLVLTLLNAYFSAIEIAMVSVRPFRIQRAADKGNPVAKKLLTLLKNPEEYLSAIQVGITLIAILEGLYGGEAFQQYLEPKLLQWNLPAWLAHSLSLFIGVGSITYFSILLGELLPKSLALQTPQRIALGLTNSLWLFTRAFYPIVWLLTWSTHLVLRFFSINSAENKELTDEDLKSILSLAYRQGTIQEHELKLHEKLFSFYDQSATQIMTPLAAVVSIDETQSREKVNAIIRSSPHIYFPVVRAQQHVIGVLSAKDFLANPETPMNDLLYRACNIDRNESAADVLLKLQTAKIPFAAIVENNDQLVGIVTMHNIGESLIGHYA